MSGITICCSCGRTIKNEFIYCPWCGDVVEKNNFTPKIVPHLETEFEHIEFLDTGFEENESNLSKESRISQLEMSLDKLEKDLSSFISKNGA